MKTEEGNELIALFMGKKKQGEYGFWITDGSYTQYYRTQDLRFHSSWDWLMPVVKKVWRISEELDGKYHVETVSYSGFYALKINNLYIHADIETVWQAVIEFISWLNSEQSVQASVATEDDSSTGDDNQKT